MKKIIYIFICLFICQFAIASECKYLLENKEIKFRVTDNFGCTYEDRDLHSYENNKISLSFELTQTDEPDLQLKIKDNNKFKLFDLFPYYSPETDKIRDIVFVDNLNILVLLHGYNAVVTNESGETEVDAAFYKASIYKIYNNIPIKILSEKLINSFKGVDGFYNEQYQQYPYKMHINLLNKVNQISLTNKDILISLETLLKQDLNSSDNQSENLWSASFLKSLITDIPITINNTEYYNNIAFYFEKITKYDESVFLLNEIIRLFPTRTVAYINLGDSLWEINKKEEAIKNYQIYTDLMIKNQSESKIPQRVKDRLTISLK